MECLNEDMRKRKKRTHLYIGDMAILITASSILLGTKYEFYEFSDNPLTKEYHCYKVGFCINKYRRHCYARHI